MNEIQPGDPVVFPDDTAHDSAVFAQIAQTHPGVIRTISLLITELSDLGGLVPELRGALGHHLRRIGDIVIRHADQATKVPIMANETDPNLLAQLARIEGQLESIATKVDALSIDMTPQLDRLTKLIGHTVISGFQFTPTDPDGSVLLTAERHRGGVVDSFAISTGAHATASRRIENGAEIWCTDGAPYRTLEALLALPRHGSPGTPTGP